MNSDILQQRLTAEIDGPLCFFLFGMRFNRLWKPHTWIPVLRAMSAMIKELESSEDIGFLGARAWLGNPTITVQYWKSFEALESYAKSADHVRRPAWHAFNLVSAKNGDVGLWHETYRIEPGGYECTYNNMPPFGQGKAARLVPASGRRESAAGRMARASG